MFENLNIPIVKTKVKIRLFISQSDLAVAVVEVRLRPDFVDCFNEVNFENNNTILLDTKLTVPNYLILLLPLITEHNKFI